jgi:hypothetical protein
VTRFVAIFLAVAVLAVAAAVATLILAPPSIAPLTVTTVVLTTIGLALAVRSTLVDRADLRADIHDGHYGVSGGELIEVRLYNRGRRPVKVEEMGFGVTKDRPIVYHGWMNWTTSNRDRTPELPMTLGESESDRVWTWPVSIARWLIRHSPPAWLYAKDSAGLLHWWRLPTDVAESIRRDWATAEALIAKEEAEQAAKEARREPPVDDYGQPIGGQDPAPE